MGRKDYKRKRIRQPEVLDFADIAPANPAVEKQKARKLRQSAWWKRKISDGCCYYCRQSFKPADLTMDHLIPIARGGVSEKMNLVACCKLCNSKKKYMMPFEWQEYLDSIKDL